MSPRVQASLGLLTVILVASAGSKWVTLSRSPIEPGADRIHVKFSLGHDNHAAAFTAATKSATPKSAMRNDGAAGGEVKVGGALKQVRYLEEWHAPYGAVLPSELQQSIQSEIDAMPVEDDGGGRAVNTWTLVGPSGMVLPNGNDKYSGRVLELRYPQSGSDTALRVGTAGGGIWKYLGGGEACLTDDLPTQRIGSFDIDPTSAGTLVAGTGEPWVSTGSGLFMTQDNGFTWQARTLNPQPTGFYRVRYGTPTTIHAGTSHGYYRSTDTGATWPRSTTLQGHVTDLVIHPTNPSVLYLAEWGTGLWKSTNAGGNWTQLAGGLPTTNIGRGAVAIAKSNPNHVYVAFATNSTQNAPLLGVYKTTNGGTSFTNVSPANYLGAQGWYDNVIEVSKTNANEVIAGGVTLMRSTNGGTSWAELTNAALHPDYHALLFDTLNSFWAGHDGGWTFSANRSVWDGYYNRLPITQYYHIDAGTIDSAVLLGGSQDNGISLTTNSGSAWSFNRPGDGAGVTIDPNNSSRLFAIDGVWTGGMAFRRQHSTNKGVSWTRIDTGIQNTSEWFPKIRNDRANPINIWSHANGFVYSSSDYGSNWTQSNTNALPASPLSNLTVSKKSGAGAVVYATLPSTTTGNRLWVQDAGTWAARETGLPNGVQVRKVAVHPSSRDQAYAIINGLSAGLKIFRTTDRGASWGNVSSNLPNVAMADLVAHPTDDLKLYVGSESGCFRTTNGGNTWHKWNNGLPSGIDVREMAYLDFTGQTGQFYVLIGTFGRSIWKREVSGDDPSDVPDEVASIAGVSLEQNAPNPCATTTEIAFSLDRTDEVRLHLFDVSGRRVREIVEARRDAGAHSATLDTRGLANGTYFYRLESGHGATLTRKLQIRR